MKIILILTKLFIYYYYLFIYFFYFINYPLIYIFHTFSAMIKTQLIEKNNNKLQTIFSYREILIFTIIQF